MYRLGLSVLGLTSSLGVFLQLSIFSKFVRIQFGNQAETFSQFLNALIFSFALGSVYWAAKTGRIEKPLKTGAKIHFGLSFLIPILWLLIPIFSIIYHSYIADWRLAWWPPTALLLFFLLLFGPLAYAFSGMIPLLIKSGYNREDKNGSGVAKFLAIFAGGALGGLVLGELVLPWSLGLRTASVLGVGFHLLSAWMALTLAKLSPGITTPVVFEVKIKQKHPWRIAEELKYKRWKRGLGNVSGILLSVIAGYVYILVFLSAWRLSSQVVPSSVYLTGSLIVLSLGGLTLGHALGGWWLKKQPEVRPVLCFVTLLAGIHLFFTPLLFYFPIRGLMLPPAIDNTWQFIWQLVWHPSRILLIPSILLGMVLALTMRPPQLQGEPGPPPEWKASMGQAGWMLGMGLGVSTLWFFLLETFSAESLTRWSGLLLITASTGWGFLNANLIWRLAPPLFLVSLAFFVLDPVKPLASIHPNSGEQIVNIMEGRNVRIASVIKDEETSMRINNEWETLNPTSGQEEIMMAIALLMHPSPKSLAAWGPGSFRFAWQALQWEIPRVESIEPIAELAEMAISRDFRLRELLLHSENARFVIADPRSKAKVCYHEHDLILSISTSSSLESENLSREHFQQIYRCLDKDGVLVKWFNARDWTPELFISIATSMKKVFPSVSFWRTGFEKENQIIGIMAKKSPLPEKVMQTDIRIREMIRKNLLSETRAQGMPYLFYLGSVTGKDTINPNLVHTADRPRLDYILPLSWIPDKDTGNTPLNESEMVMKLNETLFHQSPPETDPLLPNESVKAGMQARAGYHLLRSTLLRESDSISAEYREMKLYWKYMNYQ